MVKKPWLARTLPMPPQVRQVVGEVPALAPEPEQLSQVTDVGTRICAVLPSIGLGKRDLHVVAEVGAALARRALARAALAHELAEQIVEHRRHRGREIGAEVMPPGRRPVPASNAAWPKRS